MKLSSLLFSMLSCFNLKQTQKIYLQDFSLLTIELTYTGQKRSLLLQRCFDTNKKSQAKGLYKGVQLEHVLQFQFQWFLIFQNNFFFTQINWQNAWDFLFTSSCLCNNCVVRFWWNLIYLEESNQTYHVLPWA